MVDSRDQGPTAYHFFGLTISLIVCMVFYVLLQAITVLSLSGHASDRPLAVTAEQLMGSGASLFIAAAAMISVVGAISSIVLSVPRLLFSLATTEIFPPSWAGFIPGIKLQVHPSWLLEQ